MRDVFDEMKIKGNYLKHSKKAGETVLVELSLQDFLLFLELTGSLNSFFDTHIPTLQRSPIKL